MRTFYGDPTWPVAELMETNEGPAPVAGDELCDGHQMHYIWDGEAWT